MRKYGERPHQRALLITFLFPFLILLPGCGRPVRIAVPEPDIAAANEAAKEGDIAFGRKDFYAALIKYLESVKLNPGNGYTYNRLGITYSQLKYYNEAAEAFVSSIQLNPKYPFPYNNLGSVYFAQKNLKKAEKYFRKSISIKEDEASFHMNLGSLYLEKNKREKAVAEWRRGLAIDPNVLSKNVSVSLFGDPAAMMKRQYLIARLMAARGDVESAIRNLKLAITNGFTDIEAIHKEPDFDPIRQDKLFAKFIEETELTIRLRSRIGLPEDSSK